MTTTSRQYRFEEACNILNVSPEELAKNSGVSLGTIKRISSGTNMFGVQQDTAERLARALGLEVGELVFSTGVSNYGRPAGTGKPIANRAKSVMEYCPEHGYEHHNSRPCPKCANEL